MSRLGGEKVQITWCLRYDNRKHRLPSTTFLVIFKKIIRRNKEDGMMGLSVYGSYADKCLYVSKIIPFFAQDVKSTKYLIN